MAKPKFTDEETENIWQMYNNGTSVVKLQELYDVGETTIRRVLKRKGKIPDPKFGQPKIPYELNEEIVKARRSGESLDNLASRYGVNVATIEDRLRMGGVKPFEHAGKFKDECIHLYQQGLSLSEIGRQLRVIHHYVSYYLDVEGIRKKGKKENINDSWREKLSRKLSDETKAQIVYDYTKNNLSIEE